MILELYVWNSLLELMGSSGISSMSVSLCPFWLKCCGTASVVLFCMALRCSPNLSRRRSIWSVFAFSALDHVDEVFRCLCDCLLDMMYLACVFECTWGQTVLNEGAGFTFFWVTFLDSRRASLCLCIFYFCFYEEIAEVAWASVCDERFSGKTSLQRFEDRSMGNCLEMILLRFLEAGL